MKLVIISAWNDSGGGYLNRLLDGHPALSTWPYELLLGEDSVNVDSFTGNWFHGRFRWPRLSHLGDIDGEVLFDSISDLELKAVLSHPSTAKHNNYVVSADLGAWKSQVAERWQTVSVKTQSAFLTIYISTFFELWTGVPLPSDTRVLAHCPIAALDAREIWTDFPDTKIIHIIRSPEAGFHDMRVRHPDLNLEHYALKWNLINTHATVLTGKYPDRARLIALTDLLSDRDNTLRALCDWLGIAFSPAILQPAWNGQELDPSNMGPFGGVPSASTDIERSNPSRLDPEERQNLGIFCAGTRSIIQAVTGLSV